MPKTPEEIAAEKKAAEEAEAKEKAEAESKAKADADAAAKADELGKKSPDTEIDLDAEIAKEEERRQKSEEAFKERQSKRKEAPKDDEQNKPLTQADRDEIIAQARDAGAKEALGIQALTIARTLASSDKEAQLIFMRWRNRAFPTDIPLTEQVEEVYAITHRKKIIGERNEALRALAGKQQSVRNDSQTHREGQEQSEPKMTDADRAGYSAAGFVWDGARRMYKKDLGKGKFLFKDPKTSRVFQTRG